MSFASWAMIIGFAILVGLVAGRFKSAWEWIVGAWAFISRKKVPTTTNSFVLDWIDHSESAAAQALLRLVRSNFRQRGDADGVKQCTALIVAAAEWDDDEPEE